MQCISWTDYVKNIKVLNWAGIKKAVFQGVDREDQEPHGQTTSRCGQGRPRATWTDNIKVWTGKTKSHMDRQHQGVDRGDQEPRGQTTSRCGQGRPRATWTDNIKVWTGKTKNHVDR